MPVDERKQQQEFHCTSCGYHGIVRIQPRGCPLCHAPSPARAPWGGAFLEQARPARALLAQDGRLLVRS